MRTIEEIKMAWVYGVVCSWDDKSFDEFNQNFGWDKKIFKRFKRLHEQFDELEKLCAAYKDERYVVLPCKWLEKTKELINKIECMLEHYDGNVWALRAIKEWKEAEQALKEQVK